jgi:hypothetical protein
MFGKTAMPANPKEPDPVRIPSPDDPDLIAARRKRMEQEFAGREGKASTQLSPTSGGSAAYSRTSLG